MSRFQNGVAVAGLVVTVASVVVAVTIPEIRCFFRLGC